jgi:hypothetical protein
MPPDLPFAHSPYIAVLNNKETPEDEWVYGPITAEALFGKRTARLVKWGAIKAPAARDNGKGYAQPRRDHALEFYPVLPIYGSQFCEQMVHLLYGPNEVQPSLKTICYTLKNYVDAIPTEATRSLARRSVASFVTNSANDTQIGTTLFDTAAAAVPEAKAAIKAWADRLVDKCLNPRSVSFLDNTGNLASGNGPNTGNLAFGN